MTKLSSVIDEIVKTAKEETTKIASGNDLSKSKTSPTISTDLGQLLLKTAEALKEAETDVSYEDLRNFIERVRNA